MAAINFGYTISKPRAIDIDRGLEMVYPKLIAAIRYAPRYRAAASAAAVASFNDSPIFFGAVTVPA